MKKEFYTLETFSYESEAQWIKSKLESEGIKAFIWEENINYHLIAGHSRLRLQVYKSDKEKAIAIYKELKSYVADEHGNLVACKICGRKQLEVIYLRKNLLYKLFPFLEPKKYRCDNCNFLSKSLK